MALQYYNRIFFKDEVIANWAEKESLITGKEDVHGFFAICLKLVKKTITKEKYACFIKKMWKHGKKRLSIGMQVETDDMKRHTIKSLEKYSFTNDQNDAILYTKIKEVLILEKPKAIEMNEKEKEHIASAYSEWDMIMCQLKSASDELDIRSLQKWSIAHFYNDKYADDILLSSKRCLPKDINVETVLYSKGSSDVQFSYGDFKITISKDKMQQLTDFIKYKTFVKNVRYMIALAAIKYASLQVIESTKENHWIVGEMLSNDFFEGLLKLDVNIEGFSSPFSYYHKFRYCSPFESDKALGSLGSFFDYDFKQRNNAVFLDCHKFIATLMDNVVEHCLNELMSENSLVFIILMPRNWEKTSYGKTLEEETKTYSDKIGMHIIYDEIKFGYNIVISNNFYWATAFENYINEFVRN